MWRLLFALLLIASPVSAQQQSTAYDALKVVGAQFHRAALSRVISVTGVDGDPQPVRWTVVIADRNALGGVRELEVANGRIAADRTPAGGEGAGAPINTARLNLDSSGAFSVASYTADKSHTNFDRVAYELRTSSRGNPTWIVTLQDTARRPLGTIHIAANKGNVTRVQGLYQGANMAHVEQDPAQSQDNRQRQASVEDRRRPAQDDYADADVDAGSNDEVSQDGEVDEGEGDENIVKAEIKRMFRRTKRDAQRIFERARRPFDEFISRR